jgi:predicted transcriptional regulator
MLNFWQVAGSLKSGLSRRERQIMDVLHRRGRATAAEVQAGLEDAPSYSAVRTLLRILEEKGHARHVAEEGRYVYLPAQRREAARRGALKHLVDTFFAGSAAQAAVALLDESALKLSDEDLSRLEEVVERARKEGSK